MVSPEWDGVGRRTRNKTEHLVCERSRRKEQAIQEVIAGRGKRGGERGVSSGGGTKDHRSR